MEKVQRVDGSGNRDFDRVDDVLKVYSDCMREISNTQPWGSLTQINNFCR